MDTFYIWGPILFALIVMIIHVKWDPTFRPVNKRGGFYDPYIKQARIDQKNADYPGCQLGIMQCRSTVCGCNERRPHREFVKKRAFYLMENGIPDDDT